MESARTSILMEYSGRAKDQVNTVSKNLIPKELTCMTHQIAEFKGQWGAIARFSYKTGQVEKRGSGCQKSKIQDIFF